MIVAERITPRLTHHARERCAEMGVTTKRAKRIVQDPDVSRPAKATGGDDGFIAVADHEPDIAVVYKLDGDVPVILTVVWRTYEPYDRATYRP